MKNKTITRLFALLSFYVGSGDWWGVSIGRYLVNVIQGQHGEQETKKQRQKKLSYAQNVDKSYQKAR